MYIYIYIQYINGLSQPRLKTADHALPSVAQVTTAGKITEPHKEEAKARNGLERHIRRRREELHTDQGGPVGKVSDFNWDVPNSILRLDTQGRIKA
jgi:hypothetical protein